MIARRARLTPAMMHYYFKDREQLLDALVDERFSRFISYVWDSVQPDADPSQSIRGIVDRLLEGIEKMPWIPSIWLREILIEDGLLRERILRRLPYDKARGIAKAIAAGQARKSVNSGVDPLLTVASALGLVMLHTAGVKVWARAFHREPVARQAMQQHITSLLINGLRHNETKQSAKSRSKKR
jgi:AcrR family transcriptional regulator